MNTESVPVIKRIAISCFRFLSWWQAGDDCKRMSASQWMPSLELILFNALSILSSCLLLPIKPIHQRRYVSLIQARNGIDFYLSTIFCERGHLGS